MSSGKKRVTVGHSISLGVLAKFCHGPIDRITQFFFDDKVAASGSWDGTPNDEQFPDFAGPAHGQSVMIDSRGLFGSDYGGVWGRAIIRMGSKDQPVNELFTTAEYTGQTEISADRGVLSVLYTGSGGSVTNPWLILSPFMRQFYWGNRPQLPRFGVRGQRVYVQDGGIPQWYPAVAGISHKDEREYVVDADTGIYARNADVGPTPSSGVYFGGLSPADKIKIVKSSSGEYLAWSPWGDDSYAPETWTNALTVRPDGGSDQVFWGELYVTAAAANAAANLKEPIILTGSTGYWVYLADNEPENNRGGLSVSVSIIQRAVDMNPVHAIRERLVSKTCGLDMPEAALDDAQLKHCADILYDEGMGVSFLWDRSKPVSELIEDICFHIDALYPQVDRRTGLLYLPLIRDDYDRDNVFVLDKSNIVKIEDYKRPAQSDLFNTIVVKYNDLEAKKEMSITRSDPALLKMQGGIRAKDYNMYFFSNYQSANKAAIRLLRAATKRIRTCTAYCDRSAASLRPGDVVRMFYDAPEFEGVIMRVLGVRYGTGRDQQVTLLLSEDIYDFDASAVITTDEPVDIPNLTGDLEPITQQRAFELPYYEMAQNLGDVEAYELTSSYPEVGYIGAVAGNPASFIDAKIHVDSGAGYEEIGAVEYSPVAILAADMGLVNPDGSIVELAEVVDAGTIGGARIGSYFMIDDECIRFDGIDIDGKVMMGRGCLDTVPAEHLAGAVMYFADDMLEVINEQYMSSETVEVKLLPNTGSQILDINDATAMSVTMASRASRPYLPGNVKLNGEYFPAEVSAGDLIVTWSHRDRTQQTTGTIIDFTDGDIGPEDSVEYEIKNYDADTETVIFDSGLITGATVTVPAASIAQENRLEIKAFRNTLESYFRYAIHFRSQAEIFADIGNSYNLVTYNGSIAATGVSSSAEWGIVSGSLPAGLHLVGAGTSASIFGAHSVPAGAYDVTIAVSDISGTKLQTTATIIVRNSALFVGSSVSPYLRAYNLADMSAIATPNVSGGQITFSLAMDAGGSEILDGAYRSPFNYRIDATDFSLLSSVSGVHSGAVYSFTQSADGSWYAMTHETYPFLTVYDSNFVKQTNPAQPAGSGPDSCFIPNSNVFAVSHLSSPFVALYNTDTWTKLPNPATLPTGNGEGIAASPDGSLLAVAHANSPFVTIYDTATWTKLPNPATLPVGNGNGAAFSPDGSLLVVSHASSPFITIYDTATWAKLPNPSVLPTGSARRVKFSPDGSRLAVAHNNSPFVTIYDTATWTKLANPSTLPPGNVTSLAFTGPVPNATTPAIAIYGSLPSGVELSVYDSGSSISFFASSPVTVTISLGMPSTLSASIVGSNVVVSGTLPLQGMYMFDITIEDASANQATLPIALLVTA